MKEFAGRNILLVVENNAVPFDKRVWREALSLQDAGARVSVVCPVFGPDKSAFEVIEGVEVYRYHLTFSGGSMTGYLREYIEAFVKTTIVFHKVLFRNRRVHVVHVANPPDIFWPLAVYVRLFGTRFIFDEHDLTPETFLSRFGKDEAKGGIALSALRLFQRLSYRFAHAIISTNESYKSRAIAAHPRNRDKTFVVRNGPDTRKFKLVPPRQDLKRGRKFMAAYIGIMGVQDGVDYVIRALDILVHQKGFDDLMVYLIGSGDDLPRLKELVAELKVEPFIVFTGRIPDDQALEVLSTADVCLSPDPYNPLNDHSTMNKVMEYMCLGKAMVSFDLKEARFSAGESALYVENNNAEAFADGIVRLLTDRPLASTMGERGRLRVDEHLCWQKQSMNLLAVYHSILDRIGA